MNLTPYGEAINEDEQNLFLCLILTRNVTKLSAGARQVRGVGSRAQPSKTAYARFLGFPLSLAAGLMNCLVVGHITMDLDGSVIMSSDKDFLGNILCIILYFESY